MTKQEGFSATVPAASLLSTLSKVALVIERRNTIPVLGCFAFEAGNRTLVVRGNNLDAEIVATIGDVQGAGRTCLPAAPLLKFLRACSPFDEYAKVAFTVSLGDDKSKDFDAKSDRIKVAIGSSSIVLFPVPYCDFPLFPAHDEADTVDMPAGAIPHIIGSVAQSISKEETRYYLNGICLEFEGALIRAVATNGHIMSAVTQSIVKAVGVNKAMILPRGILPTLSKIVGAEQCEMSLRRNSDAVGISQIYFTVPGFVIKTKLIDGTYPDWRRVVPADGSKSASFQLANLQSGIRVARAGATVDRGKTAKLTFAGSALKIVVRNAGEFDVETSVPCDGAEGFEIGFNTAYLDVLANAMKRAGTKTVKLIMSGPGDPSKLVGDDDAYGFHVIMPMRI